MHQVRLNDVNSSLVETSWLANFGYQTDTKKVFFMTEAKSKPAYNSVMLLMSIGIPS